MNDEGGAGEQGPVGAPDALPQQVLATVLEEIGGSPRTGQQQMVSEICTAIDEGEHLLIQAGTGTGKSVGYLVPALVDCVRHGHRALVSTATLALQRQILLKDAPVVVEAVQAATGVRPKVALLKGWSNYLCVHRLQGGYPVEGSLLDLPEVGAGTSHGTTGAPGSISVLGEEVQRLRAWAATTDTGDRDDLVPGTSGRAWNMVSVNKRECLGKTCPLIEECFPQAAREQAAEADLVVTNHSLLGIHAISEGDLFPEIDLVIVDEAHALAERVREQASVALSLGMLNRVARSARTNAKVSTSALESAAQGLHVVLESLPQGLLEERPDALDLAVRSVDSAVRDGLSQVQDCNVDAAAKALARAALDEAGSACQAWMREADQSITWVERPMEEGAGALELVIAPVDVARAIADGALGERPAVLTSATLSLGGSFDALARECGLMVSTRPWRGVDVGSPFDPATQGILYVATHLPDPGPPGLGEEAARELVDLVNASGGGALALFSSWKGAEAGAAALRAGTDMEILVQGEESTAALVQQFRDRRDSCLVGTLSLWQGVDVPGPACRLVVIDRIPFPHPDNPVVKARTKDATRRRLSGFHTVSLTHAALTMAQGAGRLLRSTSDRGVVAVLDRRLSTKSYGSYLRASLPAMWPTTDPQVVRSALRRLGEQAAQGQWERVASSSSDN